MITTFKAFTRDISTQLEDRAFTFTMDDPKYEVRDISGLGPVKADLAFADNASQPGGVYLSNHVQKRNIVLSVGYNPDYAANETISDLREDLYKLFVPGVFNLEIEITDDVKGTYLTKGYVESCEPNLFTQDPEMIISILCPDPYFTKKNNTTVVNVPSAQNFTIPFDGNVPVGFLFEFDVVGGFWDNWALSGYPTRPDVYVGTITGLQTQAGDHWEVSSVRGNRYAKYVRSGQDISFLPQFVGSLNDFKLYPGNNYFQLIQYNDFSNKTITYDKLYEGV